MRKITSKSFILISKRVKVLITLSIFQFGLFPLVHYSLYRSNNRHYFLQDFFYESIKMRLEDEKQSSNYSFERLELLNSILQFESDSVLNLKVNRFINAKVLRLEYLDSIKLLLNGANLHESKRKPTPIGSGGGGIPPPHEYLVAFKSGEILMLSLSNNTIGEEIEHRIFNQRYFYERELDLSKELSFLDFWISSVSLFNFSEMIPNSTISRLIWLLQSAFTFLFLFYLSKLLT